MHNSIQFWGLETDINSILCSEFSNQAGAPQALWCSPGDTDKLLAPDVAGHGIMRGDHKGWLLSMCSSFHQNKARWVANYLQWLFMNKMSSVSCSVGWSSSKSPAVRRENQLPVISHLRNVTWGRHNYSPQWCKQNWLLKVVNIYSLGIRAIPIEFLLRGMACHHYLCRTFLLVQTRPSLPFLL